LRRFSTVATRRIEEINLRHVGPQHVLRTLTTVGKDQDARVPIAEVTRALELQGLAVIQNHRRMRGAAAVAAVANDRPDQAEGNVVVDAGDRGVERLGRLALVEVVNQAAGQPAAVTRADAPSQGMAR